MSKYKFFHRYNPEIVVFEGESLVGANLQWANLQGANLQGANLQGANLQWADLQWADLQWADLQWANLQKADLRGANLQKANLQGTNLREANLQGTNLREADPREADLREADLREADLRGANLRGANLDSRPTQTILAGDGDLVVYKKLGGGCIATLLIPKEAKRLNATGRKCRAEYAIVQSIEDINGNPLEAGVSTHDPLFVYNVGKTVRPDHFDEDWRNECTGGIHFFITKQEAKEY